MSPTMGYFAHTASGKSNPKRKRYHVYPRRFAGGNRVKHLYLAAAIAMALCATSIAPGSADTATPAPAMSATPAPAMTPAPAPAPAMSTMPAMDFGNPPSGEVPILFNDHHVYSRPDTLRQGRVLAALVYNG